MQTTESLLGLLRERGKRGLPLTRVYRQLYNTNLYLSAYGRVYRNAGAMTPGVTDETADGTSLETFDTIIAALKQERYQWQPARRTYIVKKNGKKRPLGLPTLERQASGGSDENDPGCLFREDIQRPFSRFSPRSGMPHGAQRNLPYLERDCLDH